MEIPHTRKRTIMKRSKIILFGLLVACLLSACRSKDELSVSMDPVDNIEALWQIIDTRYCYINTKGIDWPAIHDEYVAKATELQKGDQMALFDLCASMLDSLKDGHVNLYSSFDRSYNTAWFDTFPAKYSASLQAIYLHDYRIAGGLYYCTIDDGQIGYVYYSSFSNSVGTNNLYWIFSTFKDCKGLIIDVRNNGGGEITNAYRLAAPFFTEDDLFGYWQHKTGPGHNDFSNMEAMKIDASLMAKMKWDKPVVVLCNRRTYSAANLYVNMMRYAEKATVVGGISGGGGGMPMSYELPCGWMVRFSSVRMYDREKKDIEPGIEPDILVTMQSTDKDDIIEKAIELIEHE